MRTFGNFGLRFFGSREAEDKTGWEMGRGAVTKDLEAIGEGFVFLRAVGNH